MPENVESQRDVQDNSNSDSTIPFVGQWRRLISTTNWDKGRIVYEWRIAMQDSGAEAASYTDEAWSQIVGGVTPQHVGRLRRVFGRFHETYEDYRGLYWSHFCAAVDWEDAEMWLEGAVQNGWSVSNMRKQRWETLGAKPAEEPLDDDIIDSELDEEHGLDLAEDESIPPHIIDEGNLELVTGASDNSDRDADNDPSLTVFSNDDEKSEPPVRPFAKFAELPEDLATAFEDFKLAILQHKMTGWKEVSQADVLGSLDSLRALALAPSGEAVPS